MAEAASRIEWKLEAAWISILTTAIGETAKVMRWGDQTEDAEYPCVLVHCSGSSCPEVDTGFDYPVVSFIALTKAHSDQDPTGVVLHNLIGRIRAMARDSDIRTSLTAAEEGLTVFYVSGTESDFPPLGDEDHKIRQASISIEHKATCYDFPEEE